MPEAVNQKSAVTSGLDLERQIRLLDGRIINISIDKPFSIKGDSKIHYWNLSWLENNTLWGSLMLRNILQLFRTHSLQYSDTVSYAAKTLFDRSLFHKKGQLHLDSIAKAPELIPMSYWPFLQPLLKRLASNDADGALSDELKKFLHQPTKWETKGKGAYFALVTNDPVHGALTEQELFSIQEGVNAAFEKYKISLAEYALVWFLIGTGVRPVQIARMKVDDVKIYDGPEGREVTLYVPLAKGGGVS